MGLAGGFSISSLEVKHNINGFGLVDVSEETNKGFKGRDLICGLGGLEHAVDLHVVVDFDLLGHRVKFSSLVSLGFDSSLSLLSLFSLIFLYLSEVIGFLLGFVKFSSSSVKSSLEFSSGLLDFINSVFSVEVSTDKLANGVRVLDLLLEHSGSSFEDAVSEAGDTGGVTVLEVYKQKLG